MLHLMKSPMPDDDDAPANLDELEGADLTLIESGNALTVAFAAMGYLTYDELNSEAFMNNMKQVAHKLHLRQLAEEAKAKAKVAAQLTEDEIDLGLVVAAADMPKTAVMTARDML